MFKFFTWLPFFLLLHTTLTAQQSNCLAFQTKEGAHRRLDTKAETLFTYTSETMKTYLSDKNLLVGNAYLTYVEGGYYLLNVLVEVALANAPQAYGTIPTKSNLTINFLDGETISLKSSTEVVGVIDTSTYHHHYKAQYSIGGSQLKKLKIKELDKINITWSTGIEAYEIYDVDFLIRQFECLEAHQ